MNTLYMNFLHIYYCFLKTPRSGVLIDIHFKNLQQYGVLKYILLILLGKNSYLIKNIHFCDHEENQIFSIIL